MKMFLIGAVLFLIGALMSIAGWIVIGYSLMGRID